MAKLKREDLKQIVKECLVELLSEGLQGTQNELRESRVLASAPSPRKLKRRPKKAENQNFESAVSRNVSSLTDDPMMAALFEDTARGTYQDQLSSESAPGKASMMESVAPGADLGDVFGEQAAQNWAALAFNEGSKKP